MTGAVRTVALALLVVWMAPAAGDVAPVSDTAGLVPAPATASDSPRASLSAYLDLCRAGRFAEAARYLALSATEGNRGPDLARRLKAVLDRHLWVDLDSLSALSEGQADDGLPPGTDEVGKLPGSQRRSEPVRLVRLDDHDGVRWAFSPGTVARIDDWYAALDDRWVREHLPGALLRPGPLELVFWQWLALPLLVGVAWGAGRLFAWALLRILGRAFARTRTTWDDALLALLRGPMVLAWTLGFAGLLLPSLGLTPPARDSLAAALNAGGVIAFFWALWRAVDIAGGALGESQWGRASASARSVLSIGVRAGKVGVLGLGLVAALSQLGYPVASLLAGLGLGGLALALAAQKTVEHLFGSIALAVDQPFRVGDFVRIEDFVGTVEAIGLRSTRFRTLDRTLISIPNGRLADMRLESFTARDRLRLACTIGLVYGTSATQLRTVLEGLERVLREHPSIWPEAVVVRFKELASSSLDVEVMAWFQTSDWPEFQLIRQELLLRFMEVVEQAGTSFAFPTRTLHVVAEGSSASA